MSSGLSKTDIEEVTEVFELFDFWDGRDGEVDAFKVGDVLRSLGMNPTQKVISELGGTDKMGEKSYKLDAFLTIYKKAMDEKETGTFADFMEAFKTFDREGQGFISAAEMRHVLTCLGEKLTDGDMDHVMKFTETREDLDGNMKYEEFIKKVMAGPFGDK